jgi:hypothetical protein
MEEIMKIGTITFHWATNYGAVLQAFALQQYLKKSGFECEIINYLPLRIKLIQSLINIKNLNLRQIVKEAKIKKFRNEYLTLSRKTYFTNNSLKKSCNDYDIYICGSDQVWNEPFALNAEGRPTLSYYLNFVNDGKTRISYAASFGTDKLSTKVIDLVKPELQKYKMISVRENTGKSIVENDLGLKASLVVDPTLLLTKESYEAIIADKIVIEKYQFFTYLLHENQKTANIINDYIYNNYFKKDIDKRYNQEPISMIEWLYNINNAKLVLTNSYHGVIFSILFQTPFIVVPVENSGMNDRVITLLHSLGLQGRAIDTFDKEKINNILEESIDWDIIDKKIQILREGSTKFLETALNINK